MMRIGTFFLSSLLSLASAAPAPVSDSTSLVRRHPTASSSVRVSDTFVSLSRAYATRRPTSEYFIYDWTDRIPNICYREAIQKNAVGRCGTVANLEVFEVYFQDAGWYPWLFCRCLNTRETKTEMVEKVAKIPPGIRQVFTSFIMKHMCVG